MTSRFQLYQFLQLLTSAAFIGAGVGKWLLPLPVYEFSSRTGLSVGFLHVVGVTEIVLALLKLLPITSFAGQLGLTLLLVGVLGVHALAPIPVVWGIPAAVLLPLMLAVLVLNYNQTTGRVAYDW